MGRRMLWFVLFALFVVALLAPVLNIFQPLEKTTIFTDGEFQVFALAFEAGLFLAMALLLFAWFRSPRIFRWIGAPPVEATPHRPLCLHIASPDPASPPIPLRI